MAHARRRALALVASAVAVLGLAAAVPGPAAVAATSRFYTSDPAGDAHSPPGSSSGPSDPRFDIRSVRATKYLHDVYGVITFTDLKPASFRRYQFVLIGTNDKGGVIELRQAVQGPPTTAYYDLRPGSNGTFTATQRSCSGAYITERTAPNKISFDIPRRCFIGQGDQMTINVRAAKWSESSWQPGRLRSYPGPNGAITADAVFDSWAWR